MRIVLLHRIMILLIGLFLPITVLPQSIILPTQVEATELPRPILTMSIDDAEKTELFRFFHLQRQPRYRGQQPNILIYKPQSSALFKRVSVFVSIDSAHRVRAMMLELARHLIDSPRQSLFARDFAVNFFRQTLPAEEKALVEDLLDEVGNFSPNKTHTAALTDDLPPQSAQHSKGFRVFTGELDYFVRTLGHYRIEMSNIKTNGVAVCLIGIHEH